MAISTGLFQSWFSVPVSVSLFLSVSLALFKFFLVLTDFLPHMTLQDYLVFFIAEFWDQLLVQQTNELQILLLEFRNKDLGTRYANCLSTTASMPSQWRELVYTCICNSYKHIQLYLFLYLSIDMYMLKCEPILMPLTPIQYHWVHSSLSLSLILTSTVTHPAFTIYHIFANLFNPSTQLK